MGMRTIGNASDAKLNRSPRRTVAKNALETRAILETGASSVCAAKRRPKVFRQPPVQLITYPNTHKARACAGRRVPRLNLVSRRGGIREFGCRRWDSLMTFIPKPHNVYPHMARPSPMPHDGRNLIENGSSGSTGCIFTVMRIPGRVKPAVRGALGCAREKQCKRLNIGFNARTCTIHRKPGTRTVRCIAVNNDQ